MHWTLQIRESGHGAWRDVCRVEGHGANALAHAMFREVSDRLQGPESGSALGGVRLLHYDQVAETALRTASDTGPLAR